MILARIVAVMLGAFLEAVHDLGYQLRAKVCIHVLMMDNAVIDFNGR